MADTRFDASAALIDMHELEEAYVMRRLLEPYAMKCVVARMSVAWLQQAWNLNRKLTHAVQRADASALAEADRQLHFHLYERCGSPGLADEIRTLWIASRQHLDRGGFRRRDQLIREHHTLLEGMARRDRAAVAIATAAHAFSDYVAVANDLTGRGPSDPLMTTGVASRHDH